MQTSQLGMAAMVSPLKASRGLVPSDSIDELTKIES